MTATPYAKTLFVVGTTLSAAGAVMPLAAGYILATGFTTTAVIGAGVALASVPVLNLGARYSLSYLRAVLRADNRNVLQEAAIESTARGNDEAARLLPHANNLTVREFAYRLGDEGLKGAAAFGRMLFASCASLVASLWGVELGPLWLRLLMSASFVAGTAVIFSATPKNKEYAAEWTRDGIDAAEKDASIARNAQHIWAHAFEWVRVRANLQMPSWMESAVEIVWNRWLANRYFAQEVLTLVVPSVCAIAGAKWFGGSSLAAVGAVAAFGIASESVSVASNAVNQIVRCAATFGDVRAKIFNRNGSQQGLVPVHDLTLRVGQRAVAVENLVVDFYGENSAPMTFDLPVGVTAVISDSGIGKSTLCKALANADRPYLSSSLQPSADETLEEWMGLDAIHDHDRRYVVSMMKQLNLEIPQKRWKEMANTWSDGQTDRLFLAKEIAAIAVQRRIELAAFPDKHMDEIPARMVLLDEMLARLPAPVKARAVDVLKQVADDYNVAFVLAVHDLNSPAVQGLPYIVLGLDAEARRAVVERGEGGVLGPVYRALMANQYKAPPSAAAEPMAPPSGSFIDYREAIARQLGAVVGAPSS